MSSYFILTRGESRIPIVIKISYFGMLAYLNLEILILQREQWLRDELWNKTV